MLVGDVSLKHPHWKVMEHILLEAKASHIPGPISMSLARSDYSPLPSACETTPGATHPVWG